MHACMLSKSFAEYVVTRELKMWTSLVACFQYEERAEAVSFLEKACTIKGTNQIIKSCITCSLFLVGHSHLPYTWCHKQTSLI